MLIGCCQKSVWLVIIAFQCNIVCSFSPYKTTVSAFEYAGSLFYAGWEILPGPCLLMECCKKSWIPADIRKLETSLISRVYGQHLVRDITVNALRSHFRDDVHPSKALALSFHGWPGGGKNYVSSFIVDSLYLSGFKSKYVHFFSGLIDFPLQSEADIYKMQLSDWVRGNVSKCERSLFIFDEVDKMHEKILDGIKPFMDYHHSIGGVDFRSSVFIFLSNTGASLITEQMIRLWEKGLQREQLKLRDFENLIKQGAFNEKGGFHRNEAIESNLIDHYVPFLPLEEKHVKRCIIDEFRKRRWNNPDESMIKEVLDDLTFGPQPLNRYSIAGCKRIGHKVAALTERHRFHTEL